MTRALAKRPARRRSGRRLFAFDRSLGRRFVAGADEAGRGSLAGPLVAAAVLFDLEQLSLSDRRSLSRLNDSKQHTEEGREELYPLVLKAAARSAIVVRCVRGIDARGLHNTNLQALRCALRRVAHPDGVCLVDGFRLQDVGAEQRPVVGGDSRSAAIAAASVLAKVTRDRYMRRAAERHPGWEFETNVGYSTPEHRAAIAERGISPIHRLSFRSIAYQQLTWDGIAVDDPYLADAASLPDGPLADAAPLPDAAPFPDAAPIPDAASLSDAAPLADATPIDVESRRNAAASADEASAHDIAPLADEAPLGDESAVAVDS